jgi:hypothetical protein
MAARVCDLAEASTTPVCVQAVGIFPIEQPLSTCQVKLRRRSADRGGLRRGRPGGLTGALRLGRSARFLDDAGKDIRISTKKSSAR